MDFPAVQKGWCQMAEAEAPTLTREIAAYEGMRSELETDHLGKWVVVHGGELVGLYDTFDDAAAQAIEQFGSGPYLIREIGAPPITLPASVLYNPVALDGAN